MRNLNEMTDSEDPSVQDYLGEFSTDNFEEYVESWMTAATIEQNETTGMLTLKRLKVACSNILFPRISDFFKYNEDKNISFAYQEQKCYNVPVTFYRIDC